MARGADVGSTVRLSVSTQAGPRDFEGVLLPPAAEGVVTIKLVNGYNLSHKQEDVESLQVLSRPSSMEAAIQESPDGDDSLPKVLLIHTGGTIASRVDYSTGAVTASFEPDEIIQSVPELAGVARIQVEMLGNMWSDDVRPRHWNRMIESTTRAFAEGYQGVVITHGTDTLHQSAAALSYAWSGRGSRPPGRIVLTGSQRSPDRGSSDAAQNLLAAVYWAANGPVPTGYRDGVVVVMHESGSDGKCSVLPGCAVRKSHTTKRGAFRSVNQGPIGYVHIETGNLRFEDLRSDFVERVVAESPAFFNEDVTIHELVSGPHLSLDLVRLSIESGPSAIIIRGTGMGHLPIHDPLGDSPENPSIANALRTAIQGGIPILVTAEAVEGVVNMDVYTKGRDQRRLGLIGHGSMCPPGSAVVKLHYLLSQDLGVEGIRDAWAMDLVGENPTDSKW